MWLLLQLLLLWMLLWLQLLSWLLFHLVLLLLLLLCGHQQLVWVSRRHRPPLLLHASGGC